MVVSKLAKDLGGHLQRLRKEKGLRLREIAQRSDISPAYLSKIERGQQLPRLATLVQIGQGLELSCKEFTQIVTASLIGSLTPRFSASSIALSEEPLALFVAIGSRWPKKSDHLETLNKQLRPLLTQMGLKFSQPLIVSDSNDPYLKEAIPQAALVVDATGLLRFQKHPLTEVGLLALRNDIPYILFCRHRYDDSEMLKVSGWVTGYFSEVSLEFLKALLSKYRDDIHERFLRRKSVRALEEVAASHDLPYSIYLGLRKVIGECESPPVFPNQWEDHIQELQREVPLRP